MKNEDTSIFLDALLKGDRKMASKVAKKYSTTPESIKLLYEEIMKTALYKVGELWEYNLISVAAEHLATSISESVMNEIYDKIIADERASKKVVLSCIEGEQHQVGIKMVADIFEMHGWDSLFLGSDVPSSEFISYINETSPELIAISLSIYSRMNQLQNLVIELTKLFPNIEIIIGGQAFRHGGKELFKSYNQIRIFENLIDIEKYIITKNQ